MNANMDTIILNGSPKGNKGNTEIFINQFLSKMEYSYEVRYISKENPKTLAEYVKAFETIILVLPLYIHSMPGVVMRFIEQLEPSDSFEHKNLGFILQGGFPESAQYKYVEKYFASLSKELNRNYLGTVIKGNSAGVYMMPKFMTKKLFKSLAELGKAYQDTHSFDKDIIEELKKPVELKGLNLTMMKLAAKVGLNQVMWNRFLKQNGAFDKRYDRPFV